MRRPAARRAAVANAIAATVIVLTALVLPPSAGATPAYGRRYGVSCTTCHAPLPPRLNNVGILFRKSGFRMPDASEDGKFMLKTVPAHDIGDAASLLADLAGRSDQEAEPGESKTTFELSEVEAVAGTAIGRRGSMQAMFVPWEDGEVELENAEIQWNAGSDRHQIVARGGLLQTYLWQKANHGTLTLSRPLLFDSRAVEGVGTFEGFGLGRGQIGAEVGYVFSRLKDGKLASSMLTAAVLNGVNDEGEGAARNTTSGADVYLQALQLFGERNTFGGYYYRGRSGLEPAEGFDAELKQRFTRYGVRGNYLFFRRVDLVFGAGQGWDRSPALTSDVKTRGAFGELVAQLSKRWIGIYRFDAVDPNQDEEGDAIRAHTVSSTFQAEDHLYLTAEYRWLRRGGDDDGGVVVNARLVY